MTHLLTFGKYNGCTIEALYKVDPGYVRWLANDAQPYTQKVAAFVEIAKNIIAPQNRNAVSCNRNGPSSPFDLPAIPTQRAADQKPCNPILGEITVFTDGACVPNPGTGGAAFICNGVAKAWTIPETTNNRAEMAAVILALMHLQDHPGPIRVVSDSTIALGPFVHSSKPLQKFRRNRDLVELMRDLARGKVVVPEWVRGHSSCTENNRCDELAEDAARHPSRYTSAGWASRLKSNLAADLPLG